MARKLSDDDIAEIRAARAQGVCARKLAVRYGVSFSHVYQVAKVVKPNPPETKRIGQPVTVTLDGVLVDRIRDLIEMRAWDISVEDWALYSIRINYRRATRASVVVNRPTTTTADEVSREVEEYVASPPAEEPKLTRAMIELRRRDAERIRRHNSRKRPPEPDPLYDLIDEVLLRRKRHVT